MQMKRPIFRNWILFFLVSTLGFLFVLNAFQWSFPNRSFYLKLKVFGQILERIQSDYIESKDPDILIESAIRGMISELDPHTTYFTKEQFEKWNQEFDGYSGIGIYFDVILGKITIISIIQGGPADKAGLEVGDRIIAIDGESAINIKRDDVPLKLMGPKGTKVTILVERKGWKSPRSFSLVREEVHIQSVPNAFLIRPGIGYIQLSSFTSTTENELEEALNKLENMGMHALVLDLRQNSGGYLETAVKVVDKFLPGGKKIVYTQGRIPDASREYFSTTSKTHPLMPMIVLIDRASASASEIVAGALQDWDRALIVGEISFGKGLVQNPYRFEDGSALLLTTAHYYTPSGRMIQRAYRDKSPEEYYNEMDIPHWRKWHPGQKPDRPIFHTLLLGRTVYGGGGIVPDIFFKSPPDTLSPPVRDILYSPQRPLFTFAEQFVNRHPDLKRMRFSEFLEKFELHEDTLLSLYRHLHQTGIEISIRKFQQISEEISLFTKQNLAEKLWGPEAGFQIQVRNDHALWESLQYLAEAEVLLKRAYLSRK